jgi:hypothetical protein
VLSGTGKLALTRPSLIVGADEPADYKGHFLVAEKAALGDFVFTFTAAGTMLKGSSVRINLPTTPDTWVPNFRRDNNDGVSDAGEISASSSAGVTLTTVDLKTVTATLGGTLEAGGTVTFMYRGITTPDLTAVTTYMITADSRSPLVLRQLRTILLPI